MPARALSGHIQLQIGMLSGGLMQCDHRISSRRSGILCSADNIAVFSEKGSGLASGALIS